MKLIKKLIKGALLATFAIGLFTFHFSGNLPSQATEVKEASYTYESIQEFSWVASTYAQDKKDQPKKSTNLPATLTESIAKASTFINKVFNPVIYFLTKHIGGLLSNDLIYGGDMGEMLRSIWIVSRNIVNIAFVLILLFLAIRHIFSGDENSDLKKALPSFVLMLIAINFSWLGTKLVLDAANVATNVAFSIPSGVKGVQTQAIKFEECKEDPNSKSGLSGTCMVKQAWYPYDAVKHRNLTEAQCTKIGIGNLFAKAYPTDKTKKPENNDASKTSIFCWKTLQLDAFSRSNAAYHLTYGMAKVQNLPLSTGNKSLSKVGIGTLMAIAIQVVYITAFGSLFIALIIRTAMLWILVAFSPFMVLLYYLNSSLQIQGGEAAEYLSFKALADWAFVPTKVAAVWAIGFIMIITGQTSTEKLFTKINDSGQITSKVFSVDSLFMGLGTLEEVIWLIMTIGIIWVGTFAVLTKLKIGSEIFSSINNYGTSLAKELATSPKWAPIIPMIDPNTKKLGMKSYAQTGFNPLKDLRTMREKYSQVPVRKFQSLITKFKGSPNLMRQIDKDGLSDQQRFKAFQKHTGFNTEFIKNGNNKAHIENMMASAGFKDPKNLLGKIINGATVTAKLPGTVTPQNTQNTQGTSNKPPLSTKDIEEGVTAALKKNSAYTNAHVKAGVDAATQAHKENPGKDLAYYKKIAEKAAKGHQAPNQTQSQTQTNDSNA